MLHEIASTEIEFINLQPLCLTDLYFHIIKIQPIIFIAACWNPSSYDEKNEDLVDIFISCDQIIYRENWC